MKIIALFSAKEKEEGVYKFYLSMTVEAIKLPPFLQMQLQKEIVDATLKKCLKLISNDRRFLAELK